ncbi:YaiI/YqxD family protein [Tropicibacter sp. R16_0]|uniref:YaiI/YqxD family protein n=1 Tax=Tropicibacter sp. R16_0 TaxID=2821102 RepID=UPI001ADBBE5A|nr:YaiI/YqxD family protein [Tropicibacter sp. R16_0]
MTALYIDADACPVKAEAEKVATRHRVTMYIVSNGGLRPSQNPLVETVIVAEGADVADMWIADRCGPGDVVVTGDIPLAAKCIEAGARVLRHNGEVFTQANIGQQLAMRDLMADLRAANPLGAGGSGKGFTKADRSRFLDALERELRAARR